MKRRRECTAVMARWASEVMDAELAETVYATRRFLSVHYVKPAKINMIVEVEKGKKTLHDFHNRVDCGWIEIMQAQKAGRVVNGFRQFGDPQRRRIGCNHSGWL